MSGPWHRKNPGYPRQTPSSHVSAGYRLEGRPAHHAGCVLAGTHKKSRQSLPRRSLPGLSRRLVGRFCPPGTRCSRVAANRRPWGCRSSWPGGLGGRSLRLVATDRAVITLTSRRLVLQPEAPDALGARLHWPMEPSAQIVSPLIQVAPERSAPVIFALLILAPLKSTPLRLAF